MEPSYIGRLVQHTNIRMPAHTTPIVAMHTSTPYTRRRVPKSLLEAHPSARPPLLHSGPHAGGDRPPPPLHDRGPRGTGLAPRYATEGRMPWPRPPSASWGDGPGSDGGVGLGVCRVLAAASWLGAHPRVPPHCPAQSRRPTTRPHAMLARCIEAQALHMAVSVKLSRASPRLSSLLLAADICKEGGGPLVRWGESPQPTSPPCQGQ